MKILAIDLGKNYGWCFRDGLSMSSGHGKYVGIVDWGKQFKELVELWKPECVVLSQTNNFGHWNASRLMLMQAGVAFYICGKRGIPGVELNDSQSRKVVLGKAYKKKEVQAMFPNVQADQLDAKILAECWQKLNEE
jgi:Holliday junction resolvasome RuvABC endonuclease subunit